MTSHVSRNLTINFGLRYELTSPANGRVGNFDLNRAIVVTSYGPDAVSHAGVQFDKKDWGPRIGFSWSVAKNTVVRSAFGMFYSAEANIFDDLGLNPPQLTFYAANFNAGAIPSDRTTRLQRFPSALPVGSATDISGPVKTTGPKRMIPRILEWNVSIQHQFTENWVAQVGYVGTRSCDLWNHEASDLNQAPQILDTNFCGPDPDQLHSEFRAALLRPATEHDSSLAARLSAVQILLQRVPGIAEQALLSVVSMCWWPIRLPRTWGMRMATLAAMCRTRIFQIWNMERSLRICGTDCR